jgi:hypothetical protein
MSTAQSRNVRITDDDLILDRRGMRFVKGVLGGSFGFLGFIFLGIVIPFPVPSISFELFLSFVLTGTGVYAALGEFRDRIVRAFANRGLAWVYWLQRALNWLFWGGVFIALFAIFSVEKVIPLNQVLPAYANAISILFGGFYFLLATPRLLFGQLMTESREARLCLVQFMSDWNCGKPVRSTGHAWLRRGIQTIERKLKTFGVPVPSGELYFGSSYSLFKGHVSDITFEGLAKWLIDSSNYTNVNWTIPFLLGEAKQAEDAGFHRSHRRLRMRRLTLPETESAIIIAISLGGAIYGLLVHYGILK